MMAPDAAQIDAEPIDAWGAWSNPDAWGAWSNPDAGGGIACRRAVYLPGAGQTLCRRADIRVPAGMVKPCAWGAGQTLMPGGHGQTLCRGAGQTLMPAGGVRVPGAETLCRRARSNADAGGHGQTLCRRAAYACRRADTPAGGRNTRAGGQINVCRRAGQTRAGGQVNACRRADKRAADQGESRQARRNGHIQDGRRK